MNCWHCKSELIWGGDHTVNQIKKIPTKPRCIDIAFSDRYSLSIIHLNKNSNLNKITSGFFNDSYIMGQNACSSQHIIIWYRTKKEFIESPIYRKLLASPDGKTTSLLAIYKRDKKYYSLIEKRNHLREKNISQQSRKNTRYIRYFLSN